MAMRLVASARDAAVNIMAQRIFQLPTLHDQAPVIVSHHGVEISGWKKIKYIDTVSIHYFSAYKSLG